MASPTRTVTAIFFGCLISVVICGESGTPEPSPGPVSGAPNSAPSGNLPPITGGSSNYDFLGDLEKNKVCGVTGNGLCSAAGPADSLCQKIAENGGGCDPKCSAINVCQFSVPKPVKNPSKPGTAYVSCGVVSGYGVIFPCPTGGLVITYPTAGSPQESAAGPTPAAPVDTPTGPPTDPPKK